jgi:hypothetical protein
VGRHRFILGVLALVAGLLLLPSAASATTDRADYVAQAENACSSISHGFTFSLHAFKVAHRGGRAPDGKLIRQTLKALQPISKNYGQLTLRLSQIPPAAGDESLVAQWLDTRVSFKSFDDRGVRALRAHRIGKFRHLARRQQRYKKTVLRAIDAFGSPSPFHYCLGASI